MQISKRTLLAILIVLIAWLVACNDTEERSGRHLVIRDNVFTNIDSCNVFEIILRDTTYKTVEISGNMFYMDSTGN